MKSSNSPSKRSRFVSILIAGSTEQRRRLASTQFSRHAELSIEQIALERLGEQLQQAGVVGSLVVLPEGDAAAAVAQVESALAQAAAHDRGLPVFVIADGQPAEVIAAAFRAGAADVLFSDEFQSSTRLTTLLARRVSRAGGMLFGDRPGMPRVIGSAPTMRDLAGLIERVSPADATVLILGESGTGKELIARAIHCLSPRQRGPFIAINCAAIPETLLENELFGHEKGAYTGASSTAIGKVEAAERGTLFLDEIGEMPLQLQSKILRLLQDHTYDRIGGTKTRKADVRIVTATNRDLKEEVAAKRFREDLYYRLSVVPVTLPALRDRREDIPLIAQAIAERLATSLGRPALRLSDAALHRMIHYRWPGNVRELENELERAAVLSRGDEIGPQDLELRSRVEDPERLAWGRLLDLHAPLAGTLQAAREAVTRLRVAIALEDAGGHHDAAAAALGITTEELEQLLS